MRTYRIACGVLASLLCFAAGLYLVRLQSPDTSTVNFMIRDVAHGIGVYFIGKGFFVGPVLIFGVNSDRA